MQRRFRRGLGGRTADVPASWAPPADNGTPAPGPPGPPNRGQGLVEFALVLPVFLLLLIGVAEFGRGWMTRNLLTGASREAVRIAAVQGNAAAALSRANSVLASGGISGASVNIVDDGVPYGTCSVTVSYAFPVGVAGFLPGFARTSFPLASSTSMRKEF